MTKTVIIPDDVHLLILKKQVYIRETYGISLRITDMLVAYIRAGLDRTEELLNIKTSEGDSVETNVNGKSKELLNIKTSEGDSVETNVNGKSKIVLYEDV